MRFYAFPANDKQLRVVRLNTSRLALLMATAILSANTAEAQNASLACTARQIPTETYTQGGTVEISADSSEAFIDESEVVFYGDVELLQDARRLTADEIRYNQAKDTVDASGSIRLQQPELIVGGDTAHIELESESARVDEVDYELPQIGGRGTADHGETAGEGVFVAHRISFTTCAPGDNSWLISAKQLEVNRNTGQAKAEDATLSFKGVPLLASPWLKFPIDDRRQSGFLVPTAGYSSRNGFELGLPYYLNLAPNYDATFTPRIISRRGLLLGGEFRYLFPKHEGTLLGEMIPQDRLFDNDFRGAANIQHRSRLTERLRAHINYTVVSDDNYLEDFGRNIGITSTRYLNNIADISYFGDDWQAVASWEQKEVLGNFDRPLTRYPQLLFTTDKRPTEHSRVSFLAEYVNFQRDPGISSQRVDIYPQFALEWRKPWGYVRPAASGRYTQYLAEESGASDETPLRALYTASLDAGLFMERNLEWFNSRGTQTLEPRLLYLYTPYEDQNDIPNFDSIIPDFSYANLFRQNRFTGTDRVGDANQLSLGIKTRYIESGSLRQRFSAGVGQIFYFSDRRVQPLPVVPVETYSTSPIVGELDLTLSDRWSTNAILQWNPTESDEENSLIRLSYHDTEERKLLTLGYRYYPSKQLEYSDLAFDWPLGNNIHVLGRWQYSMSFDQTMEAVGGLEYDTCCWRLRGALRRYLANADGEYDNSFFFQLELKGLSRLGHDIDEMFGRSLYGYDALDR